MTVNECPDCGTPVFDGLADDEPHCLSCQTASGEDVSPTDLDRETDTDPESPAVAQSIGGIELSTRDDLVLLSFPQDTVASGTRQFSISRPTARDLGTLLSQYSERTDRSYPN